jgi:UDP-N-acetylmuramyl tripeptide synthase
LLSHLGHYSCPICGFARPTPDIVAEAVALEGTEATRLTVRAGDQTFPVELAVPGFYNAYNGLGACAAALTLGLRAAVIRRGLGGFRAAFGRIERVAAGTSGKHLLLALVKNPVGFNEVLRMLFPPHGETPPRHLLIIINDLIADGRDVSWLWDVDFEVLGEPGRVAAAPSAGIRATHKANPLKYAGLDPARLRVVEELDAALEATLAALPAGETLYVLPTYTAMLDFRALLQRRGWVSQFWEQ